MIQEVKVAPVTEIKKQWLKPSIRGKFFSAGNTNLWVKGVTYGTFRPHRESEYNPRSVELDFILMKHNHINAVRTYTIPPRWMLDLAQHYGIRVFCGFPWEEHVTFLDQPSTCRSIRDRLKQSLKEIATHPAILAFAIGNEIPAPIVRWHGAPEVQRFLRTLYETVKEANSNLPVTYVNYPSTEYLDLSFLDFYSFNVFLESKVAFQRYIARLHNLAGEKPLFLTEIGLDSRRNGLERQARLIRSQIWSAFRAGCSGVFVYSWTDEWFRGGQEIDDWDFGLTTRDRHPKPALDAVRKQFSKVPFHPPGPSPKISVVVCSYNGAKTIEQCLQACMQLKYDNYEVIVVDDGSTDATAEIASRYPLRLFRTPNRGLSAARNLGMKEATGDIVAYIDDDAYPDPYWLHYLSIAFEETTFACIGGPNLAPPAEGMMAHSIANSPGGPVPVLLSDEEAEHVPGCNMAFRKEALESIGGFDPQFRVAGDDVDVCWRLQQTGKQIGYHPGAMVWHHRRKSTLAYFRQQRGYGRAEVLLARKWPEKYNGAGHVSWAGRIYNNGGSSTATRIYSGIWGTAPFQSLYERSNGMFSSVSKMPEWILLVLFFAFLTALGFEWHPLRFAAVLLAGALLIPAVQSARSAYRVSNRLGLTKWKRASMMLTCTAMHFIQPIARFIGRWPLWRPAYKRFRFPVPKQISIWNETWRDSNEKLRSLLELARDFGAIISHGGTFDEWDLEAKGGAFASARLLMTVEEHGSGKQMTRFRINPHVHSIWLGFILLVLGLAIVSAIASHWVPAVFLFAFFSALIMRLLLESGRAMSVLMEAILKYESTN